MTRTSAALAALVLAAAGCKGTPIHIDNAVPPGADESRARVVEGSAYGFQGLLFIPIGTNSRHARAWQELLDEAGDAYVTDVQIKEGWYYGLVGTLYHTTFRAKAIPRTKSE